jgi:predicted transcriptional regulator
MSSAAGGRVQRPTIGDQELALLRFIAEHGPISVGAAAESFGADRGWARSTVLTVMERLRRKRYLERRRVDGVFRYASTAPVGELLSGVVDSFVASALGGSVSPFVNFLVERGEVSDDDLARLDELVRRLGGRKRPGGRGGGR